MISVRSRLAAAAALIAVSGPALSETAAPAVRDPAADSPFIAMLRQADTGHVGSVSRADLEKPLAAVQEDQAAKVRAAWRSTVLFLRLQPGDTQVKLRQLVDATMAALDEADADKDGKVTRAEAQAYADKEPDPARRAILVERLMGPDANGDGVVDAAERKIELSDEQAAEDIGEARMAAQVEGLRMWQKRSIDTLFEKFAGSDGRIRIDDIVERLRQASREGAGQK